MAIIVDCKKLALEMVERLATRVGTFKVAAGRSPGLGIVRLGDDPASRVYFESKQRQADQCGIRIVSINPNADVTETELLGLLHEAASDDRIDGIMVELPLPSSLNPAKIQMAIVPDKDVEGVTPDNLGRLFLGLPSFVPCTAKAAMYVLEALNIDPKGKQAVVVGASSIVGKPLAMLLLERWATVEVCHIFTSNLAARTIQADLLFVGAGVPNLIKAEMVKRDAVVIDIGINLLEGKIVGDVDYDNVREIVRAITPVPGGVGALTTAMLLENVLEAAEAWRS
jgi:methylenetetrahydrofolate dehydrogenase (NADP+)/methenyltetrahydrofolate cyclohydrolase